MKKSLALFASLCLGAILFAQSPSAKLLSQSQFNISDIHTVDHTLSDEFTDIQVNLRKRSIRIAEKEYTIKEVGIDRYLIDENENIYAYALGRKLKVGGKTYLVKGGNLLSEEGEIMIQTYTRTSRGTMFLGLSRSSEISDLVLGLFYYDKLLRIGFERGFAFQPGIY